MCTDDAASRRFDCSIEVEQRASDLAAFEAAVVARLRRRLDSLGVDWTDSPPDDELSDVGLPERSWLALGEGLRAPDLRRLALARRAARTPRRAARRRVQPVAWPRGAAWARSGLAHATTQLAAETGETPRLQLGSPLAARAEALLDHALAMLAETWPEAFAMVELHVERVVWLDGERYHSLTTPRAFGAIFVRPQPDHDEIDLVETLLHEAGHLELMVKETFDPLLLDRAATAPSPLRDDPRPMCAVLHAAYVLARMTEGHARLAATLRGAPATKAAAAGARRRTALVRSLAVLGEHARFTAAGAQLFAALQRQV